MEERQVSIDGVTQKRATLSIFCYCYTKPKLSIGHLSLARVPTWDRFFMRISLGYPAWEAEKAMLLQQDAIAPLAQILNEENFKR